MNQYLVRECEKGFQEAEATVNIKLQSLICNISVIYALIFMQQT